MSDASAKGRTGAKEELTALSAAEAGKLLANKSLSPVELVRAHLDRIERCNQKVHGYITVVGERALGLPKEPS